jgi:hypothetical protein
MYAMNANSANLSPDDWNVLHNVIIFNNLTANGVDASVINESSRFTGTQSLTFSVEARQDIGTVITQRYIGDIVNPTVALVEAKTNDANPSASIVWADLSVVLDNTNGYATITPQPGSTNYIGLPIRVFYDASMVKSSTGID